MSVRGISRLNELAVQELSASYRQSTINLKATVGFIDTKTGETLAWSKGEGGVWSKQTMSLLEQLRMSMEQDFAKRVLQESATEERPKGQGLQLESGGLGSHLGVVTPDAPSV